MHIVMLKMQEVDLIHMTERMYDATLAQFISVDPNIRADSLSQSYNRYSYVMNNPMKHTDPSGYFWNKLGHAIVGAWDAIKPYAGIIVTGIVMIACTICGPYVASILGAMAGGATQAAVDGQGVGGIVRADILGGIQAAVYGGIGARLPGPCYFCAWVCRRYIYCHTGW
ncbi:RHS repeat domain-containing protein [Gynuella sp.]|uniref:RHS repeat domain-containing protein n=1 Tax=Gynuella sp. TaxID=2969146 RepID=UPI003D0E129A